MKSVVDFVKREPVRTYSIFIALLAIVGYYVPSIPTELFVAFAAAVLGQGVRQKVTPDAAKVESHVDLKAAK